MGLFRNAATILTASCVFMLPDVIVADPPKTTLTVRGRVVSQNGRPVERASIFLIHQPQYHDFALTRKRTDSTGEFEFTNVPVGERVRFAVWHDEFALSLVHQIFLNPVQTSPLQIAMTPAGTVALEINDPSGRPLSGASPGSIQWDGPNGKSYLERGLGEKMGLIWPTSDSSGQLRLRSWPQKATVSGDIWHPQFARTAFKATVGGKASAAIKLEDGVLFRLKVVGKGCPIPPKGWQLSMIRTGDDLPVFTDHQLVLNQSEKFQTVVPEGKYMVMLRHPKLQTIPGLITNRMIENHLQEIEIAVTPRGNVTGRVISAETGMPLSAQKIQAYVYSSEYLEDNYGLGPGWFYSTRAITDQFGNYSISPGIGPVRLIHRSRQWACEEPFVTVNVSSSKKTTAPDMVLRDGITLKGIVTDPQGNPVSQAVIQPTGAQSYQQPVVCDAAGRFGFRVEEISKDNQEDSTGYLELFVFDPFHPLSHQRKVILDSKQAAAEIQIRLQVNPIHVPPTSSPKAEDSLIGQVAPELSFATAFNESECSTTISDYRGNFVLLHFWATWCGPCLQTMETIDMVHDLYSDHGLVVIGVHHNSVMAEAIAKFLHENPSNHVNVLDAKDGASCREYHVNVFPSYFLIGPDGKVLITSDEDRDFFAPHLIKSLRQCLNANGNLADAAGEKSR